MPRDTKGTKYRLLFLEQYMLNHTDDTHYVTTQELIQIYEENGYRANRDTIRDDIKALNEAGVEILSQRIGKGKAHHIGARGFELSELKMLVDDVSSSRFITKAESDSLIRKLTKLTNEDNRPTLTARIFTADRIKSSNTSVLYTTDAICRAMDAGKKICFHYWTYDSHKNHVLKENGDLYIASPYALIWNDDRYYLAAYSDKSGKVVTYRLDRMCDVEPAEEDARLDESFNASEFTRTTVKMMDENLDEVEVTLSCDTQFMQNVVDKFGEDVDTEAADADGFRARVTVRPSRTFFSWVFGFCGGIRITYPEDVKERYEALLRDSLEKQQNP